MLRLTHKQNLILKVMVFRRHLGCAVKPHFHWYPWKSAHRIFVHPSGLTQMHLHPSCGIWLAKKQERYRSICLIKKSLWDKIFPEFTIFIFLIYFFNLGSKEWIGCKNQTFFLKNTLSYLWGKKKKWCIQFSFKILHIDKYNKLNKTVLDAFHNRCNQWWFSWELSLLMEPVFYIWCEELTPHIG